MGRPPQLPSRRTPGRGSVREAIARRDAARRRSRLRFGGVIVGLSIAVAIVFLKAMESGRLPTPDALSGVVGPTSYEQLRDAWGQRSSVYRSERDDSRRTWTDRDRDAVRILRAVAWRLEDLRRAEARGESRDYLLEMLRGDEREWQNLVANGRSPTK